MENYLRYGHPAHFFVYFCSISLGKDPEMTIARKISKLLHDPVGVLRTRVRTAIERLRYRRGTDYDAEQYWRTRHETFGFDLRGVGDKSKSHEENVRLLEQGRLVFLDVCRNAGVQFAGARALDIGCGTGYFAEVLRSRGVLNYLGVDIADTLFDGLRKQLPEYRFQKLDVSTLPLEGSYDLIIAMDVLQHITDDAKFRYAIANMQSHLAPGGVIVISTNLAGRGSTGDSERPMFYMVNRPIALFREVFAEYTMSEPVSYAESGMFSARRNT